MEDLGVASVVATVLYARGLTQRVLSCDKSVYMESMLFVSQWMMDLTSDRLFVSLLFWYR